MCWVAGSLPLFILLLEQKNENILFSRVEIELSTIAFTVGRCAIAPQFVFSIGTTKIEFPITYKAKMQIELLSTKSLTSPRVRKCSLGQASTS